MALEKKDLTSIIKKNLGEDNLQSILQRADINEISAVNRIIDLNINDVYPNPNQPRKYFDENSLKELSESINLHGLFTPILVRKIDNKYMIIAGERRYRASLLANKNSIKAIICNLSDKAIEEIALLENIQREELNPLEEATAYKKLIEKYKYTQETLANRVGKSREYISNLLRLLKLPEEIQNDLISNKISAGHARTLLSLNDERLMLEINKVIQNNKMSVREAEKLVKSKKKCERESDSVINLKELNNLFNCKTNYTNKKISFSFNSIEDLLKFIEIIKKASN